MPSFHIKEVFGFMFPVHQVETGAWSVSDCASAAEGQTSNSCDKHKIKSLRIAACEKYKYLKYSLQ